MFDAEQKKPNLKEEKKEKQEDNEDKSQEKKQERYFKDARIHTMPEKFLAHLPKVKLKKGGKGVLPKKKSRKKMIIIFAAVGVVFLLIIAAAAWLFMRSISGPEDEGMTLLLPELEENIVQEEDSSEVCSADNCSACDEEQCLLLKDSCHLETSVEPCEDDFTEECIISYCLPGGEFFYEEEEERYDYEDYEEPTEDVFEESQNRVYSSSADIDMDGLTDVEEVVYLTEIDDNDSDDDSYLDSIEVLNLYSPLAGNSEKLLVDGTVTSFVNNFYNYSIYYPVEFELLESDLNEANLIIKSEETGEFFNILVIDNETQESDIIGWYLYTNPTLIEEDLEITYLGGKKAVMSDDLLNIYALYNNRIYLVSYSPGLSDELNFETTFKMMIRSFEFTQNPF